MTDRCILVTGSSRGIGAGLVHHYLEQGDRVAGCARGAAPIDHERYLHLSTDVADEAGVRAAFRELRVRWGRLDAIINNAGIGRMNPMALTPFDTARQIIETNFLGTFLCTHAATRLLRHSNAGRIVNLSTVAVPLRLDGESVYAASKSAVETFTRIVARELAPFGITCNAVGPGPVRTHLTESVPASVMDALIRRQAIAKWTELADVFNVVDFFLRPESAMITGQVVYLGGVG
jgi:3-oxoacyl-[acyl-carrier protein] reductase